MTKELLTQQLADELQVSLRTLERVLIYLTARGRRLHAWLAGKLGGSLDGVVDAAEVAQLTQLLLRVLQRLR